MFHLPSNQKKEIKTAWYPFFQNNEEIFLKVQYPIMVRIL